MPSRDHVPVLGLAGGVGSGKSAVASVLQDLGCVVIDSDAEARALLDEDDVRKALVSWWGERVLGDGGKIDRRRVAEIVFKHTEERARLEGLIHPRVIDSHVRRIRAAGEAGAVAAVLDSPLLYEAGTDGLCDAVLFVDAPREDRLSRVQETRGWDEGELDRREKSQLPLEMKRQSAQYGVQNDGDLSDLARRVGVVLDDFLTTYGRSDEE